MFELFDAKQDVRISHSTNLPHWFQPGVTYFVTFRTEDSIPADVVKRWHAARTRWLTQHGILAHQQNWQDQLQKLSTAVRREYHQQFSRQYLEALDKGQGSCVLKQPELSQIVADSLLYFDGNRYLIGSFVVMPNHVHLVACLLGETEIEAQCYSWKKFTATQINRALGTRGRFWQEESFDHLIRSPEQLDAVYRYIASNPAHLQMGEYHYYQRPK